MPDWQIIARIACEMGFSEAFSYDSAEDVFEEIKRFSNPKTGYDLRGASYERLRQTPLQWPCPPESTNDRNPIRYLNDGVSQTQLVREDGSVPRLAFPTANGRAVFFARPHLLPEEMPDDELPVPAQHRAPAAPMAHDDQDRQGRQAQQAQPWAVRRDPSR